MHGQTNIKFLKIEKQIPHNLLLQITAAYWLWGVKRNAAKPHDTRTRLFQHGQVASTSQ